MYVIIFAMGQHYFISYLVFVWVGKLSAQIFLQNFSKIKLKLLEIKKKTLSLYQKQQTTFNQ